MVVCGQTSTHLGPYHTEGAFWMRPHVWNRRVFGFLVIGTVCLAALLVAATASFADVAHKYPGTPMGPDGASGVVDENTSPEDYYSVYLFRGQQVGFAFDFGLGWCWTILSAPGPFGETVASDVNGYVGYTPAVSGTYTLRVRATENGQPYKIEVLGAETMPQPTITALSGPSRVKVKKTLAISGTVSPAESPGSVTMTKTHLVGTKWKSAGSTTLALVAGTFSYSFKPTLRGKWRLVAKYGVHTVGTTTYTSSKSAVKNVTVK